MKRYALMLVGVVAAVCVVVLTNYQRIKNRLNLTTTETVFVAKDDEGAAVAALAKPEDPGQRREIAETVKQLANIDEASWTKRFTLIDSQGKEVKSDDLKGQPYVANFFFSLCQATCKQQTEQVGLLQSKFKDSPIRFVSISVDPEFDTPEALAAYAVAADAIPGKWLFLTGDIKAISKIGGEMFLLGGMKRRSHPDRLCLVNAEGVLVGKYNWHEPEEIKALHRHIEELLAAPASTPAPATTTEGT